MKWTQGLKEYQDYLRLERGLSENTIINYSLDIQKLIKWIEQNEINSSPVSISEELVQKFIYEVSKSLNPRSQSRIISGLKGFFNYLIFEDYRKDHPLELIESPNLGRKLPVVLSISEVN